MKVIRTAPDLTFVLDKKTFLKIAKKIEMEPGYTTVFVDEINRAIINNQNGRMIGAVAPEKGCKVEYKSVTVQKVTAGPGFAVISYRDGSVIDPEDVFTDETFKEFVKNTNARCEREKEAAAKVKEEAPQVVETIKAVTLVPDPAVSEPVIPAPAVEEKKEEPSNEPVASISGIVGARVEGPSAEVPPV